MSKESFEHDDTSSDDENVVNSESEETKKRAEEIEQLRIMLTSSEMKKGDKEIEEVRTILSPLTFFRSVTNPNYDDIFQSTDDFTP